MRNLNKHKIIALALVVSALFFGNLQEKLKLSLNNVITYSAMIPDYDQLSNEVREKKIDQIIAGRPIDFFTSNNSFVHLFKYNTSQLSKVKWIYAMVFILVFFIFNACVLYLWFGDRQIIRFLLFSYGVLSIVSIGFFVLGQLIDNPVAGYGVARKILGALQSLVPTMLLFPAVLIFNFAGEKEKSNE